MRLLDRTASDESKTVNDTSTAKAFLIMASSNQKFEHGDV